MLGGPPGSGWLGAGWLGGAPLGEPRSGSNPGELVLLPPVDSGTERSGADFPMDPAPAPVLVSGAGCCFGCEQAVAAAIAAAHPTAR
jgi:hypothetical protein